MSTEQQPAGDGTTKPIMQVPNAGRRRIARAGIGAAGVLLTLESRVAMATGPTCVAPSAAALSHVGNSNYAKQGQGHCSALGPKDWVKMADYWPCSKNIKFGALFPCKGTDMHFNEIELVKILDDDTYSEFIGRSVATTYLNILTGKLTVIEKGTLLKIWHDLQDHQSYSPKRNVVWTPYDVRKYLESTYSYRA